MAALTNQKHERFATEIAKGRSQTEAYEKAGYKRNDSHASRLVKDGKVQARIAELRERTVAKVVEKTAISRIWVLDMLRENLERALQRVPVRGEDGHEIGEYTYNGSVANRALELIGKELGMFVERKDVRITTELDSLSDLELVVTLAREAQTLLLEDRSNEEEDDQ